MGTRALKGVQYGLETTHGTAVAADTILYCEVTLPDSDRNVHIPAANLSKRTPGFADLAIARRVLAEGITIEDADGAYYELMPLMFSMCLVGNVTATENNTGQGDYLWTFTSPQTGAESVDSITLEVFDDTQAYEIAYTLSRSVTLTLDAASGEAHVSADLFGDRILQTTKTGGLSYTAAEMINGKLTRIYIDATYASLGSTEVTGAFVNGEIVINGGVHPKMLGSSSRLFGSHGQNEITGTATLTLERTSAVATEQQKFQPTGSSYDPTMRALRVAVTGDQLGTGSNSMVQIDMMGIWTAWQPLAGDTDGNTYDVATLTVSYDDTTSANPLVVNVVTSISTI